MCPLSMPFQAVSSKVGLLCFGFVLGWFLLLFVCFLEVFNAFFFTVNELIHRKKKKKKKLYTLFTGCGWFRWLNLSHLEIRIAKSSKQSRTGNSVEWKCGRTLHCISCFQVAVSAVSGGVASQTSETCQSNFYSLNILYFIGM